MDTYLILKSVCEKSYLMLI